jgi:hypothetical protein
MSLLWKTATSRYDKHFDRMSVNDLHAISEVRGSDMDGGKDHLNTERNVRDLMGSLTNRGYRPEKHYGNPAGHFQPDHITHIHVVHEPHSSFVMNGNHRIEAMHRLGWGDRKVKVLVWDGRGDSDAS